MRAMDDPDCAELTAEEKWRALMATARTLGFQIRPARIIPNGFEVKLTQMSQDRSYRLSCTITAGQMEELINHSPSESFELWKDISDNLAGRILRAVARLR